jgi:hypothetical protein
VLLRSLRSAGRTTLLARVLAVLVVIGLLATVSPWLVGGAWRFVSGLARASF